MAFDLDSFYCVGPNAGLTRHWRYSTTDLSSTVEASNYFVNSRLQLSIGDNITVNYMAGSAYSYQVTYVVITRTSTSTTISVVDDALTQVAYTTTPASPLTYDDLIPVLTNYGAAGLVTLTLPEAIVGEFFDIGRLTDQLFRLDVYGAQKFTGGDPGGYMELLDYGFVQGVCLVAGEWTIYAESHANVWRLENGYQGVSRALGAKDVVAYGADKSGITNSTDAWEAAMAGGGLITIPGGTYWLDECAIPVNAGDITLQPLGQVVIKFSGNVSAAMIFDAAANVGSLTTISAITDDNTLPAHSATYTSKLVVASAAGYLVGDIVAITCDAADEYNFFKAEMAQISVVSGTSLWLDRRLYYTYSGTVNIRRITTRPRLTILPGITIQAKDTVIGGTYTNQYGLWLRGAIHPDIDIKGYDIYNRLVVVHGCYGGRFNLEARDFHVDYGAGAFGDVLSLYGCVTGGHYTVKNTRTGTSAGMNGDTAFDAGSGYDTDRWFSYGVPNGNTFDVESYDVSGAGFDSHVSIGAVINRLTVQNSYPDDRDSSNQTSSMGIIWAGVDPVFNNVKILGCATFMKLRSNKSATEIVFNNPHFRILNQTATTFGSTVVATNSSTEQMIVKPKIIFTGGYLQGSAGWSVFTNNGDLATGSGTDLGYTIIANNVTFGACKYIAVYTGTKPMELHINSGVWLPSAANSRIVRFEDAITYTGEFHVWGLDVITVNATPAFLTECAAGCTATWYFGTIRSRGAITEDAGLGGTITSTALNVLV